MVIAFIIFCLFVLCAVAQVVEVVGEIKNDIEKKGIKKKKEVVINDPALDQIKFVHVTGRDKLRDENYSTIYEVSGTRVRDKYIDPYYSLFVDSSVFCMERFSKDIIVFLDSNKQPVDVSKHPYRIEAESGKDFGFIIFY